MKPIPSLCTLAFSATLLLQAQAQTSTNKEPAKEKPPAAIPAKPAQPVPESKPKAASAATSAATTNAAPGEIAPKTKFTPAQSMDQKGKIEKLDAAAGTFTVEGKNFTFSKKGKVYVDNVHKDLSELKDGDLVAVTYFEKADGANLATQIVKGYRHHKKKKASSDSSDTPPSTH